MSDLPAIPDTDIGTIERSPHRQEIYDKLCTGWSPARVAQSIERKYGIIIPAGDIAAFKKQIPPELMLKESELAKKFKSIDVEIDSLLELQRTLLLLRDRLDDALLHLKVTGKELEKDERNKRDTVVEHRAVLYLRELRLFTEMLHEIGEIKPPVIELEAKAKVPLLRAVIQKAIEGEHRELKDD